MEIARLRLGELLSGGAALALLATLFLDWNRGSGAGAQSGWSSLGVVMLLLVLATIGLALTLVFATAAKRPAAITIGAAVLTTGVGIIVTVVLALRVLFLDDSLGSAYLGLLLMLLIPVGSWLAMADERTDAPYSGAPDLPRRPVPPAEA